MKNSFKQLFRTPGKTILFFLLMLAVTLLLVFSTSLLSETTQRIDEVERSFTTIGTVKQEPVTEVIHSSQNVCWGTMWSQNTLWDDRVQAEELLFDKDAFVHPPEYRPYYLLEQADWMHSMSFEHYREELYDIIEFTPIEEMDEVGAAHCRVENVLLSQEREISSSINETPRVGMEILICQCGGLNGVMRQLVPGRRYIATLIPNYGSRSHPPENWSDFWTTPEYVLERAPYSAQCSADGERVSGDFFPALADGEPDRFRIDEVTENFYEEGEMGQCWLEWAKLINHRERYFTAMPIQSLEMLPVFHSNKAYLTDGRNITEEEFESGALVCMIPEDLLKVNRWQIGDKIRLPLQLSLYGPDATIQNVDGGPLMPSFSFFMLSFSSLRADGQPYPIFWDAEYEIVGTYGLLTRSDIYRNGDLYADTILIPKNSVRASDADNIAYYDYLDGKTATFQIPNGTIDDFDAALRAAVPEAESLVITYNDNGYTDIMKSLQSTRTTAVLLFVVGLLAAVVIILLLLYFFIVRERKRTAIERSLGMSKRQCRVSLLAGVLAVTILAACIGTVGGAVMMNLHHENAAQETASEDYNPAYSLWLKSKTAQEDMTKDFRAPGSLYALVPLALVGLVGGLSVLMVNRNLKIEPIYLLSGKME